MIWVFVEDINNNWHTFVQVKIFNKQNKYTESIYTNNFTAETVSTENCNTINRRWVQVIVLAYMSTLTIA